MIFMSVIPLKTPLELRSGNEFIQTQSACRRTLYFKWFTQKCCTVLTWVAVTRFHKNMNWKDERSQCIYLKDISEGDSANPSSEDLRQFCTSSSACGVCRLRYFTLHACLLGLGQCGSSQSSGCHFTFECFKNWKAARDTWGHRQTFRLQVKNKSCGVRLLCLSGTLYKQQLDFQGSNVCVCTCLKTVSTLFAWIIINYFNNFDLDFEKNWTI